MPERLHRRWLFSLVTRRPRISINDDATARETAACPTLVPPVRVRLRPPIALIRLLDADCVSCRGYGCESCAYTGLY